MITMAIKTAIITAKQKLAPASEPISGQLAAVSGVMNYINKRNGHNLIYKILKIGNIL